MAIVTVPVPLQEQLGEAASESLVGMFEQLEAAWDRHQEVGAVHADVNKQIAGVHHQIADVHQQAAGQTRWILTVLVGAAVLFPIIQRLMAAPLP